MTRIYFAAMLFTAMGSGLAYAQPATPSAFEVATIKPTGLTPGVKWIRMPSNGQLITRGTSLKDLIQFAYDLHPNLIGGASGWMEGERYDIVAKPEPGRRPSEDELKAMLRGLLADRFNLTFHRASREASVYVIVIAKTGSKMKERSPLDGEATSLTFQGPRLPAKAASMPMLAEALTAVLDRPVIDGTGLRGKYDFDLAWMPEPDQFGGHGSAAASDTNAPDIFTAVQEQLGLRLDSRKVPVQSLIVDHAERPASN
ncbi:MAG TPA: TIGR03435 family protein [Bryobacteraceae bacterium]